MTFDLRYPGPPACGHVPGDCDGDCVLRVLTAERDALRAQLAERERDLREAEQWVGAWIDLESRVCEHGECRRIGTKTTEAPRGYASEDHWCDGHAPEGAVDSLVAAAYRWLESRRAK